MSKKLNMLAFDYGASSGRAILGSFDGRKLKLEEIHRFSNDPVMLMDNYFWDVLRLHHEMLKGIAKGTQITNNSISSIGVDTWGVDFGLLDIKGRLIENPFHYRDKRTDGMIDVAAGIVPKEKIYNETGIQLEKYNTLYQLLSMKLSNSQALEKADALLFMPDLFNYLLTGEKSSEATITSTSQMLSPFDNDWAKGLLSKLGISDKILQRIIKPCTINGKTGEWINTQLGVKSIPVMAVAGHDTASAVFSVPVAEEKYAYLSSGTWSILGIETNNPIINEKSYKMNYTNERGVFETFRVLKNIVGLWIYQECKKQWDMEGTVLGFDELEGLAWKAEKFTCFVDPDNEVFYSPGNMPDKIIDFCLRTGQKIPQGKGEIVRCIMESLALKYRMVMEGLETISGYAIPVLHIIGGGCKNEMLCSFTTNAIKTHVITGPVEATAIGNLLSQLVAHGELSDLQEARSLVKRSFETKDYIPLDSDEWDDAYHRYNKIVKGYQR